MFGLKINIFLWSQSDLIPNKNKSLQGKKKKCFWNVTIDKITIKLSFKFLAFMYSFLKSHFFSYFFHIFKVQVYFNTFLIKKEKIQQKLNKMFSIRIPCNQSAKVRPKDALQKPRIPKRFLKVLVDSQIKNPQHTLDTK